MNFTGIAPQMSGIGNTPQLIPQQQIVVPPITIPQGFQAKPQAPTIQQLTAKGKEAAKRIPLGPGSRAAIFEEDPDQDVFYYREVDEYGNDVDFGVYSYTKVEDPPEPEYLTKQEFYGAMDEFFKRLKEANANGEVVLTAGGTEAKSDEQRNGWYSGK